MTDIPNQPLIERKRKSHGKKKGAGHSEQKRFAKVQRQRQLTSARIRDMDDEMDEWY